MNKLTEKFLSEEDKQKIIKAVEDAEKKTSGEIVPMVVSSSYHYPVSNILGALVSSIIIALIIIFLTGNENLWFFLGIFMAGFIFFHEIIKRIHPLKRLFITEREINEEVEEAAITAFFKRGLSNTKEKTGVLIFISIFERKVWILADSGINEKVGHSRWKEVVEIIIEGIKKKRQGDSIVKAITIVGNILTEHFPIRPDDIDELDNLIVD